MPWFVWLLIGFFAGGLAILIGIAWVFRGVRFGPFR